jgi:hypothetical protein
VPRRPDLTVKLFTDGDAKTQVIDMAKRSIDPSQQKFGLTNPEALGHGSNMRGEGLYAVAAGLHLKFRANPMPRNSAFHDPRRAVTL